MNQKQIKKYMRYELSHPEAGNETAGKWITIPRDYCSICRRHCGIFQFKNDYFCCIYCRGCLLMFYYDIQDLLDIEDEMDSVEGNQGANSNIRKFERTKLTLDRKIEMLKASRTDK
jgi:hypothetical protein